MPKELTNEEMLKDHREACPLGHVPTKIKPGRVLYHNHIMHTATMGHGTNGFRCWTQSASSPILPGFAKCQCGWSGLPHYAHKDVAKAKAKTMEQMIKVGAFPELLRDAIAEEREPVKARRPAKP
jgi:hypothetical protein